MRLVSDNDKMSRPPHMPARILKVYIGALIGFSHVHHPDDVSTTFLSQDDILGAATGMERDKQNTHSKDSERIGRLQLLTSSLRVKWWSCLLNDLLQQTPNTSLFGFLETSSALRFVCILPRSRMGNVPLPIWPPHRDLVWLSLSVYGVREVGQAGRDSGCSATGSGGPGPSRAEHDVQIGWHLMFTGDSVK